MKQELNTYQVADLLKQDDNANWTYAGSMAIAEFFEELENDTDESIELDVVAIRCEFSEYKNFDEVKENYSDIKTLEDLHDNTLVIEFDTGLIIQDF